MFHILLINQLLLLNEFEKALCEWHIGVVQKYLYLLPDHWIILLTSTRDKDK